MNHIYRITINPVTGACQVTSELATVSTGGRSATARTGRRSLASPTALAVGLAGLLGSTAAWAGAEGGYGFGYPLFGGEGPNWSAGSSVTGAGGHGGDALSRPGSATGGAGGLAGQTAQTPITIPKIVRSLAFGGSGFMPLY